MREGKGERLREGEIQSITFNWKRKMFSLDAMIYHAQLLRSEIVMCWRNGDFAFAS
jgi:hypothetical protein